jgi:hypothetical protein
LDGGLQRSSISETLKDEWINQALKEFAYAFKFHELEKELEFSTAIGIREYAIGAGLAIDVADFRYVEEMTGIRPEGGDTYLIRRETRSRYRKKVGIVAESAGTPEWYHRYGNKIILRPTPDDVIPITMDYCSTVDAFEDSVDVSPLNEDWDECIFVGALYRGFRYFGEFDRYQNVRNDFLGLVRSRATEYDLEEFPEGGISPLGPNDTETEESL